MKKRDSKIRWIKYPALLTVTACLVTISALQRAEIWWWMKSRSHSSGSPSGSFLNFQSCQKTMPLTPYWRTSALLSFLCSLPYHKQREDAKVSSPVPLPKTITCPDDCPGIIQSSEHMPYFPECTVFPQTPSMQPRDLWWRYRGYIWRLWEATQVWHLKDMSGWGWCLVLSACLMCSREQVHFPNTRRKMNEPWWINPMILLFSDKDASSMTPGSVHRASDLRPQSLPQHLTADRHTSH